MAPGREGLDPVLARRHPEADLRKAGLRNPLKSSKPARQIGFR